MAHNYCTCWGNRGSCIDCAEEEIDRLTAQLAEAKASAEAWQENCRLTEEELEKERNKHADIIGKIAKRDAEIATLRHQSINWVPVFDENMELQTQNAALREEVERWQDYCNNTADDLEAERAETARLKSQPTGYYDSTKDVEQARQEAAMEIIQYIEDQGMIDAGTSPSNQYLVYEIDPSDITELKQRYGLEG